MTVFLSSCSTTVIDIDKTDLLEPESFIAERKDAIEQTVALGPQIIVDLERQQDISDNERREINKEERKNLTPLRPMLDQYQHNMCFYCGLELREPIHVDHVIPYQAILHNEIWNLVLSHEACNEDKLDFIVSYDFIKKLKERKITTNEL